MYSTPRTFQFDCDQCNKAIVIVWDLDSAVGGDIPFDVQCNHCGWKGTKLARQGHPIEASLL